MSQTHAQVPREEVERVARSLAQRNFPNVSWAIRDSTPAMLRSWRSLSSAALPELDHLTIGEFENSIATLLDAVAEAMSCRDEKAVRRLIEESPHHGLARFAQRCGPHTLLAEERILRSVVIIELRRALKRPLTAEEAAALHQLLDLMGEYSLLALVDKRGEETERVVHRQVVGMHRLAGVGTLVAGVAHDATNLLLPLHMLLEHVERTELSSSAREDVATIGLIVKQFQNSIVNLRWLSVDPEGDSAAAITALVRGDDTSLDVSRWADEVADFHRRMVPQGIEVRFEIPSGLPEVGISSAALSQAVFNLIRNAQQAILSRQDDDAGPNPTGRIVVRATARSAADRPACVELTIDDDGPGMSEEVLARCATPFFTARRGGSGLGLALVRALVGGSGGSVEFISPRPGSECGTAVLLTLPVFEDVRETRDPPA